MRSVKVKTNDIEELEKTLGVTLIAKRADSTVNGYVTTIQDGNSHITEVFLYEEDKDPNFEMFEYKGAISSKGSKITIRKSSGGLEKVGKA